MHAEKARCGFRQLVGLVDNEGIDTRQQFAKAFFLQHQVGAQQVVIDNHQVGVLCRTPRLDDMAFLQPLALLTQTVISRRCHPRPDGRIFGMLDNSAISPLRVRPDQS